MWDFPVVRVVFVWRIVRCLLGYLRRRFDCEARAGLMTCQKIAVACFKVKSELSFGEVK
jgi:hypothetical protein